MKKTVLLTASLLAGFAASAQISITGTTLTYMQDFDSLSMDTSAFSNLMPSGWMIAEFGSGSANDGNYRVNNGSKNNGDTYSFGENGSPDRALGGLASNSLTPAFGATFVNNTGGNILGFTITYRGEQWRMGNTTAHRDSLIFQYSPSGLPINDSTSTSGWMTDTSLMFNSVVTSATAGALNGNAPENSMMKTGTIMFETPIADGASFTIRWKDINIAGADDGLAIDDVNITFEADSASTGVPQVQSHKTKLAVLGQPENGNIRLGFELQQAGPLRIEVRDMNGRILHQETIPAVAGAQQYQISHQNLPAGLYIIRISNGREAGIIKTAVR